MASSLGFSCAVPISISRWTKGRNQIRCIGWVNTKRHPQLFAVLSLWNGFYERQDPEGVLGAPKPGHIARLEFKRKLDKDSEAKEAFERQVREEKDRMRKLREVKPFCLLHFIACLFDSDILCMFLVFSLVSGDTGYCRGVGWVFSRYWSSGDRIWDFQIKASVHFFHVSHFSWQHLLIFSVPCYLYVLGTQSWLE